MDGWWKEGQMDGWMNEQMQADKMKECHFRHHHTLLWNHNAVQIILHVDLKLASGRAFYFWVKYSIIFFNQFLIGLLIKLPIQCFSLQCGVKSLLSQKANIKAMNVFTVSTEYPPAHRAALRSHHLSGDRHQFGPFSQHGYAF